MIEYNTELDNLTDEEFLKGYQEQWTLLRNGLISLNARFSIKDYTGVFHKRWIFPTEDYKALFQEWEAKKITVDAFKERFVNICSEKREELGLYW